jgi:hypothetical protein
MIYHYMTILLPVFKYVYAEVWTHYVYNMYKYIKVAMVEILEAHNWKFFSQALP